MTKRKIKSSGDIKARTQLAYNLGLHHLFQTHESNEEIAIRKCKECIDFRNMYGYWPSKASKNSIEVKLGVWLSDYKLTIKGGKLRGGYYAIVEKIATDAGYPDMFDNNNTYEKKLTRAISMCHDVIKFIKCNDRNPFKESEDEYEKSLGVWLAIQKKAKAGKGRYKWFPILLDIAIKSNIPNLFDRDIVMRNRLLLVKNIILYVNTYGKYPSRHTSLYNGLNRLRRSIQGRGKLKDTKIITNILKLASEAGYPNMFNSNWRDDLRK